VALTAETTEGAEADRIGGVEHAPRRLFADESGTLWTAELRRPRAKGPDHAPSRLILFWSEARACLATLRGVDGLAELTEDDLRRHLRTCLTG
jgi:hypothetical protein